MQNSQAIQMAHNPSNLNALRINDAEQPILSLLYKLDLSCDADINRSKTNTPIIVSSLYEG